jgi:hypothetical protein
MQPKAKDDSRIMQQHSSWQLLLPGLLWSCAVPPQHSSSSTQK